jgi:hypothetical protein
MPSMRVLLVGPDNEDNLSIRYLSASLRAAGHVAELAAFNSGEDHDAVVAEASGYDVVGLSMCFQSRALEFLRLGTSGTVRSVDRARRGERYGCVAA